MHAQKLGASSGEVPIYQVPLDPPSRIVPSQRRENSLTSAWIGPPFDSPPLPSGGWTTASLIGIGALPATALRNMQHERPS
jgi:hypothetical protein